VHSIIGPTQSVLNPTIRFSHLDILSQCSELSTRIHTCIWELQINKQNKWKCSN